MISAPAESHRVNHSDEPPLLDGRCPQVPGYEVQAMLGRSGMGVVYRARHLRLNRVVALKMLQAGAYAGAHERQPRPSGRRSMMSRFRRGA
jgi:eukaryotic-like serine/threonine-protein kinase